MKCMGQGDHTNATCVQRSGGSTDKDKVALYIIVTQSLVDACQDIKVLAKHEHQAAVVTSGMARRGGCLSLVTLCLKSETALCTKTVWRPEWCSVSLACKEVPQQEAMHLVMCRVEVRNGEKMWT